MTVNLDELTTDELRRQAFDKAQSAHDVHFFWDLTKHLRASRALAAEDGSGGGITGTLNSDIALERRSPDTQLANLVPSGW